MTEQERRFALALNACTFLPGITTKRFARDMAALAHHADARDLTPKQYRYLILAVIRYRRQIDPAIVTEAREALADIDQ